jgi:hypothetical protein
MQLRHGAGVATLLNLEVHLANDAAVFLANERTEIHAAHFYWIESYPGKLRPYVGDQQQIRTADRGRERSRQRAAPNRQKLSALHVAAFDPGSIIADSPNFT